MPDYYELEQNSVNAQFLPVLGGWVGGGMINIGLW